MGFNWQLFLMQSAKRAYSDCVPKGSPVIYIEGLEIGAADFSQRDHQKRFKHYLACYQFLCSHHQPGSAPRTAARTCGSEPFSIGREAAELRAKKRDFWGRENMGPVHGVAETSPFSEFVCHDIRGPQAHNRRDFCQAMLRSPSDSSANAIL
jgi:hypothetical protein